MEEQPRHDARRELLKAAGAAAAAGRWPAPTCYGSRCTAAATHFFTPAQLAMVDAA